MIKKQHDKRNWILGNFIWIKAHVWYTCNYLVDKMEWIPYTCNGYIVIINIKYEDVFRLQINMHNKCKLIWNNSKKINQIFNRSK